jgi:hypothetical protein
LLSQKLNQLAILDELLDWQPYGYVPLSVMTCLFMETTIIAFILVRRIMRYLQWSAKQWMSCDLNENFWYLVIERRKVIVLQLLCSSLSLFLKSFLFFS